MGTEDQKREASGEAPAVSRDSTVHESETEKTEQRRSLDLSRGLDSAARRLGVWNSRVADSGENVGRALRNTLFRRQRRDAGLTVAGVEFPDLLEAEASPGLVAPDPVLIPKAALASGERRREEKDRPRSRAAHPGPSESDDLGTGGDILPPPMAQPPSPARRAASSVVLVVLAIGVGLVLSIALVLAVAWGASTVMEYFQS